MPLPRTLPKRLSTPHRGYAWSRAAWVRSSDAMDEMRRRYSKLGRQLPLITQDFFSEKLDHLESMRYQPKSGWKAHAHGHFEGIVRMRRDLWYPVVMLPLNLLRMEERIETYRRRVAGGHAPPGLLEKINREEERIEAFYKKLDAMRRIVKPFHGKARGMFIIGNAGYGPQTVMDDARSLELHVEDAREKLVKVKKELRQNIVLTKRRETLERIPWMR